MQERSEDDPHGEGTQYLRVAPRDRILTRAFDGDVKGDATTVTVQATATNKAEATTKVISFGLVAGLSGASAYAEVSKDATTEAIPAKGPST